MEFYQKRNGIQLGGKSGYFPSILFLTNGQERDWLFEIINKSCPAAGNEQAPQKSPYKNDRK